MMKISVVMCAFNGAELISEQIKSILSQTRIPDELVICDDGSTDGTWPLLERIQHPICKIKLKRNEKNLGYVQNFAQGIKLAEGDLIFLSDQDDVWHASKIETMARRFQQVPNLLAYFCNENLVDAGLQPLGVTLFQNNFSDPNEVERFHKDLGWQVILKKNVAAGNGLAFRASGKNIVLPIPNGWMHDAWILSLLGLAGFVDCTPEVLMDYRQHGQQSFGTISSAPIKKWFQRIDRSRGHSLRENALEAERWENLFDRLVAHKKTGDVVFSQERMERCEEKIAHLRRRAAYSVFPLWRIVAIARERPAYAEFGNGSATALKDLLAKAQ